MLLLIFFHQGDFNHLFIRQGTGLQGQAVFRTKLSFRPHSTDSFTHQKLTRNMADRSNKAAGIKVISQVGRDPEANRCEEPEEHFIQVVFKFEIFSTKMGWMDGCQKIIVS